MRGKVVLSEDSKIVHMKPYVAKREQRDPASMMVGSQLFYGDKSGVNLDVSYFSKLSEVTSDALEPSTSVAPESSTPEESKMSDISHKEYLDAKVSEQAANHRADMAQIEGKLGAVETHLLAELRVITSRLEQMPTQRSLTFGFISTGLSIVAVVLAVLAYSSATFTSGLSISPAIADMEMRQRAVDENQDRKLDLILQAVTAITEGQ